jgi:hypothetical protein
MQITLIVLQKQGLLLTRLMGDCITVKVLAVVLSSSAVDLFLVQLWQGGRESFHEYYFIQRTVLEYCLDCRSENSLIIDNGGGGGGGGTGIQSTGGVWLLLVCGGGASPEFL